MRLHLDLETKSAISLVVNGVYRYAEDETTDVILAAYAINEGEVKLWVAPQLIPKDLKDALLNPECIIVAHNAGFERNLMRHVLTKRYSWPECPPIERWDDTAARAARMALPRSLGDCADALSLPIKKDVEGKKLMMRMCRPRQHLVDGRIIWWDEPEKVQRLGEYCCTDVEVERQLDKILEPLSTIEQKIWQLTETINDRGIAVDVDFAAEAMELAIAEQKRLNEELCAITDGKVSAATQICTMKTWLNSFGFELLPMEDEALHRRAIERILKKKDLLPEVRRVLEIRRDASKSSIAKYKAIKERVSSDGRVRGNLVYSAASTGRFAGSGVQIQNLPRETVKNWDKAREGLPEDPKRLATLSQMIRGTLRASPGHRLVWADYNAIEARGLAWIAGEEKLIEQFREGAPIYEEMAAKIFGVPKEDVKKDGLERFVGKTAVLGCGYSMGANKFRMTCAAMGQDISVDVATNAVSTFRSEYPNIPAFWSSLTRMTATAIEKKTQTRKKGLSISCEGEWLKIMLPSRRVLFYKDPEIIEVHGSYDGAKTIKIKAIANLTKKWHEDRLYGGKIAENIVQAICRDLLCHAMLNLEERGYRVVGSVHDEIICEVPDGFGSIEEMCAIMCELPKWAEGFPISAEGKEGVRYGK